MVMKKTSATLIMTSANKKTTNMITSGRSTPSPKRIRIPAPRSRSPFFGRSAPGSGRRSVTSNHVPTAAERRN